MENLLDNHDVNHMIWHKACQLEIDHAVVQKDLIQKDKEMTQVKCERHYEWGSASGKFLVRDPSHKVDVSPKLWISAPGKFLVRDPSGKVDVSPKLGIIDAQSILSLFILLL